MKQIFFFSACFAALTAVACSSSDPSTSSSSSSSSSSGGAGSSGGPGSSGNGGSGGAAQQSAINGTWDITAAGSDSIGTSSMTVDGAKITGTIAGLPQEEGSSAGTGGDTTTCTTTDKTTFSISVTGDTATATFTQSTDFNPVGCDSFDPPDPVTITASRKSGSNTSKDVFSGDWTVNDEDGTPAFAVNILGLLVKAWSKPDASGAPVLTSTVTSTQATSQTTDQSLTFAARKR